MVDEAQNAEVAEASLSTEEARRAVAVQREQGIAGRRELSERRTAERDSDLRRQAVEVEERRRAQSDFVKKQRKREFDEERSNIRAANPDRVGTPRESAQEKHDIAQRVSNIRDEQRYDDFIEAHGKATDRPFTRKNVKEYVPADTSFVGGLMGLGGILGGKAYAKGKEMGAYAVKQGAKEMFGMSVSDKGGKKKLNIRAVDDLFAGVKARPVQRERTPGFLYGGGLQPQRGKGGDLLYGIGFPNAPKRSRRGTSGRGTSGSGTQSKQSSSVFGELNFFGNPFATRKAPVTRKKKGRKSTGAKRASERSTSEFDWFW
jgi:hypothetical protein